VFANLVSIELAERQAEMTEAPAVTPQTEPAASEPVQTATVNTEPVTMEASAPEAVSAPHDPPLAVIGFGPGMLIRLSQLGVHTMADLATANPAQLRTGLGDISRLVDVDTWIRNARQASKTT
jgi:predicted flap endonuclease-1-like 5' DNA nuclease